MKHGVPIPKKIKLLLLQRSQGRCEIRLPGCTYFGNDPHHRKLRSRGGSNELENLLLGCRACHEKVTIGARDTGRFRTYSHSPEGTGEDGRAWQPVPYQEEMTDAVHQHL